MSATTAPAVAAQASPETPAVLAYLPLVERVAQRIGRRLPSHIRIEDLVSAGVVGLLEAHERYNPTRSTSFKSFAEFRIKGAILDELRRRDLMARDARLEAKQIERAMDALTRRLRRPPEEHELADALAISVEVLREKLEKLTPVQVVSINDVYEISGGSGTPFEEVAHRQMIERLQTAIGRLKERHQQLLRLYYTEGLTLRQIGEVMGVTESRVCQLLSATTLQLRALMGDEG